LVTIKISVSEHSGRQRASISGDAAPPTSANHYS